MLLFSRSVMFKSLKPHGLHHVRLPCPLPSPGTCSNSCLLSWWCHSTILSSVIPFSSCLQSFPASGPFLILSWWHQLFLISRKSFVKWVLDCTKLPLHQNCIYWPSPTTSLGQFLRDIWGAVSYAAVLILAPTELNFQLSYCASFLAQKSHWQRCLVDHSPGGLKRVGHDLATKQQQQPHKGDFMKIQFKWINSVLVFDGCYNKLP